MHHTDIALGTYPTPVRKLLSDDDGHAELWLKDDGLTSPIYGGNKVRKLERLLPQAQAGGARALLTFGAAGSHHAFATSVFGQRAGFEVRAILFPQIWSEHAEHMLRRTLDSGADCIAASGTLTGVRRWLAAREAGVVSIPPGGSSPTGCLGYVEAAHELAAQIADQALPRPDEIVVPAGSGGTAAGLRVGLRQAGLSIPVVAVPVMQPAWIAGSVVRSLSLVAARAARGASTHAAALTSLRVDSRHTGRGYGWSSPGGQNAIEVGRKMGLNLDPTYTAKAFAVALTRFSERSNPRPRGRGDRGTPAPGDAGSGLNSPTKTRIAPHDRGTGTFRVLYWHTLAAQPETLNPSSTRLPTAFQRLLVRV